MSENENRLDKVIAVLRELDSTIDIARGELQLTVLINAPLDGPFSLTKLAESRGISRKALYDAVQKMQGKGLLRRVGRDKYVLTDQGRKLRRIVEALAGKVDIGLDLKSSFIMWRTILILGTDDREWVPLTDLAKCLGVSLSTLKRMLSLTPGNLFKLRRGTFGEEVSLSYEGRMLYERILREIGLGTFTARVLALLAATPDPLKALAKWTATFSILSIAVMLVANLKPYGLIPVALWSVIALYVALLLYSKA